MKKTQLVKGEIINVKKRADITGSPVENIGVGMIAAPYTPQVLADMSSINTYHNRCINLKAQLTAGLGYELQPKGEGENKNDKKIWQEFEESHARSAGIQFGETLVNWCTDFETFGNGFLEVVRNNSGKIAELYHLRALNCTFIREEEGKKKEKVLYLRQAIMDKVAKFKMFGEANPTGLNEFIQLKQYSPKSLYYGIPEWMTALAAMYLDRGANAYNIKRFENELLLGIAILVSGGKLTADTKKVIKEFLSTKFKGVDSENAAGALYLNSEEPESKIEIKTIAAEIKEASYHILRTDNREEVVDAHGVPRRLLGLSRAGSLGESNTTKEEISIFRNICIKPRQARVEFLFNTFILPGMGISNSNFKLNQLESGADLTDAQYCQMLTTPNLDGETVIDLDEAREVLGYKKREAALRKNEDEIEMMKITKMLLNLRTMLKAVE